MHPPFCVSVKLLKRGRGLAFYRLAPCLSEIKLKGNCVAYYRGVIVMFVTIIIITKKQTATAVTMIIAIQ